MKSQAYYKHFEPVLVDMYEAAIIAGITVSYMRNLLKNNDFAIPLIFSHHHKMFFIEHVIEWRLENSKIRHTTGEFRGRIIPKVHYQEFHEKRRERLENERELLPIARRWITLKGVAQMLNISAHTVVERLWLNEKSSFPKPFTFSPNGKYTYFNLQEVENWINDREQRIKYKATKLANQRKKREERLGLLKQPLKLKGLYDSKGKRFADAFVINREEAE